MSRVTKAFFLLSSAFFFYFMENWVCILEECWVGIWTWPSHSWSEKSLTLLNTVWFSMTKRIKKTNSTQNAFVFWRGFFIITIIISFVLLSNFKKNCLYATLLLRSLSLLWVPVIGGCGGCCVTVASLAADSTLASNSAWLSKGRRCDGLCRGAGTLTEHFS